MAAVHKTATAATPAFNPPMNHEGLNVIYGEYSATLCVSGALFLAKVPHGARVIDGWVDLSLVADVQVGLAAAGQTGLTIDYVLIGTTSTTPVMRFYTGGTQTTGGVGYKVSVSDDAVARYMWVKATGSASWGGSPVKYCIMYLTDGQ